MRKNFLPLLLVTCFFGAGCQSNQQLRSSGVDNGSFMDLWNTYSHCQKSDDFQELIKDAVVLTTATTQATSSKTFVIPLPGKLEQLVSTPTTRLAVDVKAMSAACSLRASQAAAEADQIHHVRNLLYGILDFEPKSHYAFYSQQAKDILAKLDAENFQVSLRIP